MTTTTREKPQPIPQGEEPEAAKIVELHERLSNLTRKALPTAQEIGKLLCETKKRLGRGNWRPWLEAAHLPFSPRSATSYMKLWRYREKLESASVADLASAYEYLDRRSAKKRKASEVPQWRKELQACAKRAEKAAETAPEHLREEIKQLADNALVLAKKAGEKQRGKAA